MSKIDVSINGLAPLLQHRFPDAEQIEDKVSKRSGVPNREKELEQALYKLPTGEIYQLNSHIEGALVKAAKNFKISGKRGKSYKDLINCAVFVTPEAIIHKNQKYVADRRAVVMPSTRGRVIRTRPRFDEWELDFQIEINDDQLPVEVVKQILDYAGSSVGIGDYRPKFGRFIVTKFQEVK